MLISIRCNQSHWF